MQKKRCPVIILGIIRKFSEFIYYNSMLGAINLILCKIRAKTEDRNCVLIQY